MQGMMIVKSTPNAYFVMVCIFKLLNEFLVCKDRINLPLLILQIPSFLEENTCFIPLPVEDF
jgi:hypothetical protein